MCETYSGTNEKRKYEIFYRMKEVQDSIIFFGKSGTFLDIFSKFWDIFQSNWSKKEKGLNKVGVKLEF